VSFREKVDYKSIRGTFDVVVSVATGAVYMTAPSFYLASFSGTIYASVYAVYNSILMIVQNVVYSFLNAPRNGIGQVISEGRDLETRQIANEFEILTVLFSTIFLTTAYAVIIPFVLLFTQGVTDVDYADFPIALLLVVAQYIQFIHVPSGLIINVSGHFKAMKYIQLTAGVLLIIIMFIGAFLFGVYGILIANVLVGLLLAIMEITYVRRKIVLGLGYVTILKFLVVNLFCGVILAEVTRRISIRVVLSYPSFFLMGFLALSSITIIILSLNYLLFRKDMKPIAGRFQSMITGRRI
jgi:Na+-driven multidrug efflux pump